MSYQHISHSTDASLSVPRETSHGVSQIHTGHQYSDVVLRENSSAQFGDVYHQYQGELVTSGKTSVVFAILFVDKKEYRARAIGTILSKLANGSG